MEELIEELTKVNPFNLSEEGLKLFNKINEIIDRNEQLEQEITVLQNTKDTCPNYPTSGIKCELKKDVLEEE